MSDKPTIQQLLRRSATMAVSVDGAPIRVATCTLLDKDAFAAADRIDALEAQLDRAIEALAGSDACPEPPGCEDQYRKHYRSYDLRGVLDAADRDACRDCWRTHLGVTS